jgi:long-subunit fatty acid transport protein
MKIINAIVFFSFYFIANVYCQIGKQEDLITNPGWEFYSDNTLSSVSSGKGFAGVASTGDVSSVVLNPASLNINKKFQIYSGYTLKSTINRSIYGMSSYIKTALPSILIGGVYKINNNFQAGFIYRNDYSFRIIYGNASTPILPEGGAELEYKFATHSFSIPLSFNYKWLKIGADLNMTYYRHDAITNTNDPINGHSNLWRFVPQFGFIISPNKIFSFGATFTPGFTDSTEYVMDYSTTSAKWVVKYPNRIGIGTELRLMNDKLALSVDYQYSGTSKLRFYKDMHNIHFGAEYKINESWKIRSGFYTLMDFRAEDPRISYSDKIGAYDQYFITFGGTFKIKNSAFNLAFMDSHLFTNSIMHHTKISAGYSCDF